MSAPLAVTLSPLPWILTLCAALAGGGDGDAPWPDFRGPGRDGHGPALATLPLTWSEGENLRWKTTVHGRGWSSPVVAEGRVWLTTADPKGRRLSALCLDLETGEILLDRVLFQVERPQKRNALNSYASPSPVVEPGRVWLYFGNEGIACLDSETFEVLWSRRDLNCDHLEGPGSSPLLHGERLFVNVDGGDVQYVIALDKRTGRTLWKRDRSVPLERLPADLRKAFSTPIVVEVDGSWQLVSSGSQATFAYDAEDGAELWSVRHRGFSMASRPLLGDGVVYLNTGFLRPELWAVRLGGQGDVTRTHRLWKVSKRLPTMASPVLAEDLLFVVSDAGVVTCLDAKSGRVRWSERVLGQTCASPVLVGERLYLFDREGTGVVIAAADEYEKLAASELDAGCMASPAVVGDALLVRTVTHLYRIEAPADPDSGR